MVITPARQPRRRFLHRADLQQWSPCNLRSLKLEDVRVPAKPREVSGCILAAPPPLPVETISNTLLVQSKARNALSFAMSRLLPCSKMRHSEDRAYSPARQEPALSEAEEYGVEHTTSLTCRTIPPTMARPHDRPNHLALSHRRKTRRRRDGRCLQGRRHLASVALSP